MPNTSTTPFTHIYEIFTLHICYAALIGSYLPTFRDDLSIPSSRIKQFKMGLMRCPETTLTKY